MSNLQRQFSKHSNLISAARNTHCAPSRDGCEHEIRRCHTGCIYFCDLLHNTAFSISRPLRLLACRYPSRLTLAACSSRAIMIVLFATGAHVYRPDEIAIYQRRLAVYTPRFCQHCPTPHCFTAVVQESTSHQADWSRVRPGHLHIIAPERNRARQRCMEARVGALVTMIFDYCARSYS